MRRLSIRSRSLTTIVAAELLAASIAVAGFDFYLDGPPTNIDNPPQRRGLAGLPDGGFLMSAPGLGAPLRRYDAAGAQVGSDFVVNAYTTGLADSSDVATDSLGNSVVVWRHSDRDGSGTGIFARLLDSTLTPLGPGFQVNSYTTGDQKLPHVVRAPDGRFAIFWGDENGDTTIRTYDATGAPAGAEHLVASGSEFLLDIANSAMSPSAESIVTWSDEQGLPENDILARRFDDTGTPLGTAFVVNSETGESQSRPAVAYASDGSFLIAWHSRLKAGDPSSYGVIARRFDSNGSAVGPEFQVNSYTTNNQYVPNVTPTGDDGFLISWKSVREFPGGPIKSGGDQYSAFMARSYDSAGLASSCETTIVVAPNPGPSHNAVATAGGAFMTWRHSVPSLDRRVRRLTFAPATVPCNVCSQKPSVRLGRINAETIPDNDQLRIKNTFSLGSGTDFSMLDPTSKPIRIVITADDGTVITDDTIGTGTYQGSGTAGWRASSKGTRWQYRDGTQSKINGIERISLKDRSKKAPNQMSVDVSAKTGNYGYLDGDGPVRLTLVVGDAPSGECEKSVFAEHECKLSPKGKTLKCKR